MIIGIHTSRKNLDKRSSRKYSSREYKQKKIDSKSLLNLSRKNKDETALSNSIILSIMSSFLDIKIDDKSTKKNKDICHSQIKNSFIKKTKITKSSKTVIKDYNNIMNNINNTNINNSINSIKNKSKNSIKKFKNHLSLDPSKEKKKIEIKNRNLNTSNDKDLIKKIGRKESKKDFGKDANVKRKGTIGIGEAKKKNFKKQ